MAAAGFAGPSLVLDGLMGPLDLVRPRRAQSIPCCAFPALLPTSLGSIVAAAGFAGPSLVLDGLMGPLDLVRPPLPQAYPAAHCLPCYLLALDLSWRLLALPVLASCWMALWALWTS